MKIGLAGPFNPRALAHRLDPADGAGAPQGENGVPLELLAEALLARGHRVVVYTLDQHSQTVRQLQGPGFSIHIGPYRSRHRMRDGFAVERRALEEMIRADLPDILHAHWCYEYALAGQAVSGLPMLVSVHDWAPAVLRYQPTLYRVGRLVMAALALACSRHLAAPSPYIAANVTRWTRRACAVVPHGLPASALAAAPRAFPAGPPVLVAANQGFSGLKSVPALLRAFPAIRAACPGARLELLGWGHEAGGEAEQWARAHGLADGVSFIGQVPMAEVASRFAAAHLMVHPAREESFGYVLIEALGQGTPVVAMARTMGPAWVLGQGRYGCLTNSDRLAEDCIALLTDQERWRALALAGWQAARREYSMDRVAESHLALYQAILTGSTATENAE